MSVIPIVNYDNIEEDFIEAYNRKMKKARYITLFIRVRLWIEWHKGILILLGVGIIIFILYLITKIL